MNMQYSSFVIQTAKDYALTEEEVQKIYDRYDSTSLFYEKLEEIISEKRDKKIMHTYQDVIVNAMPNVLPTWYNENIHNELVGIIEDSNKLEACKFLIKHPANAFGEKFSLAGAKKLCDFITSGRLPLDELLLKVDKEEYKVTTVSYNVHLSMVEKAWEAAVKAASNNYEVGYGISETKLEEDKQKWFKENFLIK